MHHLAGHLGMTVTTLSRTMPEAEFANWQRYAARNMLPQRRLEMLLAQVSLVLAKVNGAKESRLSDFLFDPAPAEGQAAAEPTAEEEAEFFGFNPVQKPQEQ